MSGWRGGLSVLVPEAQTIGGIGVIRSLGRAGYRVVASSPDPQGLGLRSRFTERPLVQPAYGDPRFKAWLDTTIAQERIELIVPSEAFLTAIRSDFTRLQELLPVPHAEVLAYTAFSKVDVRRRMLDLGLVDNLPPALLVAEGEALPSLAALRELGLPLFLKADATHAKSPQSGTVVRCRTPEEARERLAALFAHYRVVLIEGFVKGIGVGAFLASWKGMPLAEFMHRRLHEVPHTGGYSSFRETWRHQAVMADARARAKALEWDGVGMFEYRWDRSTDRFWLMEFNARFWGSLHLALFAGVDFPVLLADAFFGQPEAPVTRYADVRCRLTFPAETDYVMSCLKDASLPWHRRLLPIPEFIGLQLAPSVYSDLNFPGDRRLYWAMLGQTMKRYGRLALGIARS